jgi:chromosome segregation ATPase
MTGGHERPARRQTRGQKLRDEIVETIREHAERAARQGEKYVYNASEIAREMGVARSTLLRNEDVVTATLAEIRARRRFRDGSAAIEALKERNATLQDVIKAKELEIERLHQHQADLYDRLIRHSVDVGALFCGYAADASRDLGKCILCGSPPPAAVPDSNVVTLKGKRQKGKP